MGPIVAGIIIFIVSYLPGVGMYIVIPGALIARASVLNVMLWAIAGNFAPALTVTFFYDHLNNNNRIRKWLDRLSNKRIRKFAQKYGFWFIFFITPWTGTWVTGLTAKALNMDDRRYLIVSAASLIIFTSIIAGLIYAGVRVFPDAPDWLSNML